MRSERERIIAGRLRFWREFFIRTVCHPIGTSNPATRCPIAATDRRRAKKTKE
jgi:hypothetical protein